MSVNVSGNGFRIFKLTLIRGTYTKMSRLFATEISISQLAPFRLIHNELAWFTLERQDLTLSIGC